jgi:TfoX/Sxy family transcriptional regulator of competence genes
VERRKVRKEGKRIKMRICRLEAEEWKKKDCERNNKKKRGEGN